MIDFSKIKISEEKAETFNGIQLKGGVVLTHVRNLIGESNEKDIENARAQIKIELWKKIYGDLAEPINELKSLVKEYLLEPGQSNISNYHYRPYFLNDKEVEQLINKIDNLLKMPE